MEENSYKNLCLMEKSTVNPFAYVYINNIDVTNIFHADYNKNAKYVYFTHNDVKYIKFKVSVNLNNKTDDIDRRKGITTDEKFITLKNRGLMNRNSLDVYCNGLKIPDNKILVTIYSGSTDLYIPLEYFNHNKVELTLIVNKYSNKCKYYNSFSNKIVSGTVKIPFLDKIENVDSKCLRIYRNGYLITKYTVRDNTINLSNESIKQGDEVEFIYKENTRYMNTSYPENKIISFPSSVLKDKPIPLDVCEVYLNGIRQMPKDLTNNTPRHVGMTNYTKGDYSVVYAIYNDELLTSKNHYIDDLTQFFNYKVNDAAAIITGAYEGFLPEYIKNIKFPPEIYKVFNEDYTKLSDSLGEFLSDTIKKYIAQNPENFKYLLNNNVTNAYDYTFNYDNLEDYTRLDTSEELGQIKYMKFSNEKIVFTMSKLKDEVSDNIILFVNGKKLHDEELTSISYRNKWYIYVDKDLIPEGSKLQGMIFPIYNQKWYSKEFTSDTIEIVKQSFGVIQGTENLLVMRSYKDGWLAVTDLTVTEDDKTIKIKINNYNNYYSYIVYNSSYSYRKSYTLVESDLVYNQPTKVLYDLEIPNDDKHVRPMVSFYSPLVFKNDVLLAKGNDYEILTPYNNTTRNKTEIYLRIRCEVGDKIDIIYTESYYESLGSVDYVNSQYGIVYFDELVVPFDSGYIDLYVDGKLVSPDDIEVISTNIIKVSNVENLINIRLQSKLSIPLYLIKEYTDTFLSNPSMWQEYLRIYWYSKTNIDTFYREWNPYGKKVISDRAKSDDRIELIANEVANQLRNGLLPRLINCNYYYDFSENYSLRELLIDNKDYIEINCNKEQIATALDIDMEAYMKSYDEIVEAVSEYLDGNVIDANTEISEDSELWSEIYEDELDQAYLR